MKISDLYDGQVVTCRTGRSGRVGVEWDQGGKWHGETLYVARRPNGELLTITLRSMNWAEGGMRDFCEDPDGIGGSFVVEDWYLQIEGLTK